MNAYSRVNDMSTTMKSDGRHNFTFLRVFTSLLAPALLVLSVLMLIGIFFTFVNGIYLSKESILNIYG